jgi:hypothetical protein
MGGDQLRKHPGRREVALLRNLEEDGPVLLVPEKLAPVRMEPKRLMELKIKRDERHVHTSAADPILPRYIYKGISLQNQQRKIAVFMSGIKNLEFLKWFKYIDNQAEGICR